MENYITKYNLHEYADWIDTTPKETRMTAGKRWVRCDNVIRIAFRPDDMLVV